MKAFRLLVACLAAFGLMATAAWAFQEGWGQPWGAGTYGPYINADCAACHGFGPSEITEIQNDRSGPHGGFTNATDDCDACHSVHEAASSSKLLPASTILGVCNSCHDLSYTGTGGSAGGGGPYGAIRARGEVARARHNIEAYNNTETAPSGGDKSYAATSVIPGGGTLAENLTCDMCHSPHGNTSMQAFGALRYRMNSYATTIATNRILQDDVNGAPKGTYTVYGADWCAACHTRRHSDAKGIAGVNNHPVDQTGAAYLSPAQAAQGLKWEETATADGTMPVRRAGWSREATPGWAPQCQQCHWNSFDVEIPWQITQGVHMGPGVTDGRVATDNPRFQLFPHESVNPAFLVESGDDLCMNCHPTLGLP